MCFRPCISAVKVKNKTEVKYSEVEIKMIGLNVKSLIKTKCKDKWLKTMLPV